jgi:hypothetical protein
VYQCCISAENPKEDVVKLFRNRENKECCYFWRLQVVAARWYLFHKITAGIIRDSATEIPNV